MGAPLPIPIRVMACVLTVAGCATGAGLAAAQTVPAVPAVPVVPGAETAEFRLVIEGTSTATRDLDLGGSNGICDAQVNVHLEETATWQRGRGVVVRFTKLGTGPRAPVLMTRVGSPRPAVTVVVSATRTSSGAATRTPSGPPEACPPVSEDLSGGPDCGKPDRSRAVMSLLYAGGLLRIRQTGLGALPEIDCPVSQVYGGTPDMRFSWPTPPALRPELIAPSLIFGNRRAFVVRAASGRARTNAPIASGPLTGRVSDFGQNRVTVRFIRLL